MPIEVIGGAPAIAQQINRCSLSKGSWYSPYEDRYIEGPMGLGTDYPVPLAEAQNASANTWSVGGTRPAPTSAQHGASRTVEGPAAASRRTAPGSASGESFFSHARRRQEGGGGIVAEGCVELAAGLLGGDAGGGVQGFRRRDCCE